MNDSNTLNILEKIYNAIKNIVLIGLNVGRLVM